MSIRPVWAVLAQTFNNWSDDQAPRLGAALSYYTIFSLAPLLVIIVGIAGLVFDPNTVRTQLNDQFRELMGPEGEQVISAMVAAGEKPQAGIIATIIGIAALFLGATGVFIELKSALNTIWRVRAKPGRSFWGFIRDYYLSFAMVLGIGFLLLVLLVISAGLSAVLAWLKTQFPLPDAATHALDLFVSWLVVTMLFALIFKYLPDAIIRWRDVWLGAAATSVLFTLGKFLIGLYIGHASLSSSYGAAGTVLVVLVWSYYSAQILLLGAEFTRLQAQRFGGGIRPKSNAEFVDAATEVKELKSAVGHQQT